MILRPEQVEILLPRLWRDTEHAIGQPVNDDGVPDFRHPDESLIYDEINEWWAG